MSNGWWLHCWQATSNHRGFLGNWYSSTWVVVDNDRAVQNILYHLLFCCVLSRLCSAVVQTKLNDGFVLSISFHLIDSRGATRRHGMPPVSQSVSQSTIKVSSLHTRSSQTRSSSLNAKFFTWQRNRQQRRRLRCCIVSQHHRWEERKDDRAVHHPLPAWPCLLP